MDRSILLTLTLTTAAVLSTTSTARPDLIRLKNGGEIRGKVEGKEVSSRVPEVTIETWTGTRITLRSESIEFVTPRSMAHEEYETRSRSITHTVDAHWELAEWCRTERLMSQRAEQLEQLLELDPEHEAAHRGLGHTIREGQWMTRDELMTSRGYIKHKGRYVTQQELDLIEKSDQERKAEQAWFPKVRLWFNWAGGTDPDRRNDGLRQLAGIDDPDAVPALESQLAQHEDATVRMAFVKILKSMAGPKPVRPLVERSLADPDDGIRYAAVEAIQADQHPRAAQFYAGALQDELNITVCRAAEALGRIGTSAEIDDLIAALVTTHQYRVQVRDPGVTMVSGAGGTGMSGGTLPSDVEAGLLTGQYPYGAIHVTPPIMNRTRTVKVKRDEQNLQVWRALKKLTGQDFGYDERSWSLWWSAYQNDVGTTLPTALPVGP